MKKTNECSFCMFEKEEVLKTFYRDKDNNLLLVNMGKGICNDCIEDYSKPIVEEILLMRELVLFCCT